MVGIFINKIKPTFLSKFDFEQAFFKLQVYKLTKYPPLNFVLSSVSVLQIIAVHTNSLDEGKMELLINSFLGVHVICVQCIHAV